MIHGAGLEDEFWAEAVLTTATLKNRCQTTAVNETMPYKCFMYQSKYIKLKGVWMNILNINTYKMTKKRGAKSNRCTCVTNLVLYVVPQSKKCTQEINITISSCMFFTTYSVKLDKHVAFFFPCPLHSGIAPALRSG